MLTLTNDDTTATGKITQTHRKLVRPGDIATQPELVDFGLFRQDATYTTTVGSNISALIGIGVNGGF